MYHNKFVDSGFTLIEVLIALLVLSVGVSSCYTLYVRMSQTLSKIQTRSRAMHLVQNAGEYALAHHLFPASVDAQEPVSFTYQDHTFVITPQTVSDDTVSVLSLIHI